MASYPRWEGDGQRQPGVGRDLHARKPQARKIRLVSTDPGPVRLRELALFASAATLGAGVKTIANEFGWTFPTNQHLVALNQVGYLTAAPKRFSAPQSPDGSRFEVRPVDGDAVLFSGAVQGQKGDFSAFAPADSTREYVVTVSGGGLALGRSDPFSIRRNLYQEQFWQAAIDFMVDCRSVVGTHPSAYGGCPWRDGTYYAFEVPSLILFYLADPARVKAMPVQLNWQNDKARVLAPDFPFDPHNPHSEGVMDAVRRYYTELEPPRDGAPDVIQLVHWGLGLLPLQPRNSRPQR